MHDVRVLLVDDEPMVREVLARYLEHDGYEVVTAGDGEQALERFDEHRPDLVLLDLMLPRIDGLEVFRRLRAVGDVPVIMITARGQETDRIVGLDLGADDYVAKPLSPREVVSRVRAVLRRAAPPDDDGPAVLVAGDLEIDLERREARKSGMPVGLTRKEFDLLAHMAARPGVTLSRTRLLEDVWDFAWEGDSSTVTVHMRRLREKIEDHPSDPTHLITVWGVGYRFEP
ncbi:MAG TPA: response regulator transcription factor [Actinomycetota bacterium]|nr:response regulator transcription factor [Actinomycetota bacterium]